MSTHQDKIERVNEQITAKVIASIGEGLATGSWTPPWQANPNALNPVNPITGRRYTGGNRFNLAVLAAMMGRGTHWATYDQWASLSRHAAECVTSRTTSDPRKLRRPKRDDCESYGCDLVHVRKGEHGTYALRPIIRKDRVTDEERTVGFAPYTVFSSDQIDGYTEPAPAAVVHDANADAQFAEAAAYAERIGVTLEHSVSCESPSWSPSSDVVTMPSTDRWSDPDAYWSALVHEMIHWTGHPDRQDRIGCRSPIEYGSPTYAREELIAELGSAFHLAHLGRISHPREDHMQYLAGWLKILNEDSQALWKAATFAESASKMLGRRFGIINPTPDAVLAG